MYNTSLQPAFPSFFGRTAPIVAAMRAILLTLLLSVGFQVSDPDAIPSELLRGR